MNGAQVTVERAKTVSTPGSSMKKTASVDYTKISHSNMNNESREEGVLIVFNEMHEPIIMARKNGTVKYYKLEEMGYADHAEFLGADIAQNKKDI